MVKLATKTLAAINESLELDQGNEYRNHLEYLLPKIKDIYRQQDKPFRSHMGISGIGGECAREIWYSFHWMKKIKLPAKLLRLFNRGHMEEARFIALLKTAGFNVWYEQEDGGQYEISDFGGHFGSALDVVVNNCPDFPSLDTVGYGEFKTVNEKSFKKLSKEGLADFSKKYYVQMQLCMKYYNFEYGLFLAVNKNTDELYAEIVTLDTDCAERYRNRAHHLIFTDKAPSKISHTPTWFECKFCEYSNFCHGNDVPEINCRTCIHSVKLAKGGWDCSQKKDAIHNDDKYRGCNLHIYNPELLNGVEIVNGNLKEGWIEVKTPSGVIQTWGPEHMSSLDLLLEGFE